jgi:hypothetical protein
MLPITPGGGWQGRRASAKVEGAQRLQRMPMSGAGLKTLSLALLVALVAYVAWSGGT